jgi:hypothetical protein
MPGSQKTVAGSNVGKSSISGAISMLEKYWLNHAYLHKDDPESQVTLRSDIRIRQFEEASKSNEPKRIEQAQMLKAIGTSSGNPFLSRAISLLWADFVNCPVQQIITPLKSSHAAPSGA